MTDARTCLSKRMFCRDKTKINTKAWFRRETRKLVTSPRRDKVLSPKSYPLVWTACRLVAIPEIFILLSRRERFLSRCDKKLVSHVNCLSPKIWLTAPDAETRKSTTRDWNFFHLLVVDLACRRVRSIVSTFSSLRTPPHFQHAHACWLCNRSSCVIKLNAWRNKQRWSTWP